MEGSTREVPKYGRGTTEGLNIEIGSGEGT